MASKMISVRYNQGLGKCKKSLMRRPNFTLSPYRFLFFVNAKTFLDDAEEYSAENNLSDEKKNFTYNRGGPFVKKNRRIILTLTITLK